MIVSNKLKELIFANNVTTGSMKRRNDIMKNRTNEKEIMLIIGLTILGNYSILQRVLF